MHYESMDFTKLLVLRKHFFMGIEIIHFPLSKYYNEVFVI